MALMQVGAWAAPSATGRLGQIVQVDPADDVLTYKIAFSDAQVLPSSDWFGKNQVVEAKSPAVAVPCPQFEKPASPLAEQVQSFSLSLSLTGKNELANCYGKQQKMVGYLYREPAKALPCPQFEKPVSPLAEGVPSWKLCLSLSGKNELAHYYGQQQPNVGYFEPAKALPCPQFEKPVSPLAEGVPSWKLCLSLSGKNELAHYYGQQQPNVGYREPAKALPCPEFEKPVSPLDPNSLVAKLCLTLSNKNELPMYYGKQKRMRGCQIPESFFQSMLPMEVKAGPGTVLLETAKVESVDSFDASNFNLSGVELSGHAKVHIMGLGDKEAGLKVICNIDKKTGEAAKVDVTEIDWDSSWLDKIGGVFEEHICDLLEKKINEAITED